MKSDPTIRSFFNGEHDKQEVYDFVYKKIIEQGKASIADDNMCSYRSENGCMCAAGHLITNEDMFIATEYDSNINTMGIRSLSIAIGIDPNDHDNEIDFIRSLQDAHDEAAYYLGNRVNDETFLHNYKVNMNLVAKCYSLKGVENEI